jgi:hypothetical protein
MNDHDHSSLATLLREDVASSDPRRPLDAMVPVRLGRRRLRSRRLSAAGAAAALVAVAGVVVPLATAGDHQATPAAPPGSAGDQVRALLEPSTGELPTPTVAVGPAGTTVTFNARHDGLWHDYRVTTKAGAGLEDPAEHCREAMEERGYVSCSVERGPDGTTAVVQVLAVKPVGEVPADSAELGPVGDNIYARVPVDSLAAVDPRDRFFRREVLVATSTGTVSVNEQVNVADPGTAEAAYVVPVGTLLEVAGELATHPEVFGSP